ncbi:MAG: sugar phosphate isomerase/epimerase family protein [Thermoguttaceae bacterium]
MTFRTSRRLFLGSSVASAAAAAAAFGLTPQKTLAKEEPAIQPLHLGLMTYNLARDWDLDTVIKNCKETGFEHMELRTTHAHGVEVSLSKEQRADVRRRVADSGLKLSLASGFAYHWDDSAQLRDNIEGTKEYLVLAQDVGALGIRVFPNALLVNKGVPEEKTVDQIAKAVAELGAFAADRGVELRLENHGQGTNRVSVVNRILDAADSPHVYMIWNCDKTDVDDPGLEANFQSVKDRIRHVHLHELSDLAYPYRELFRLLRQNGYQGSCHAEVDSSQDPIRFMHYYRALFLALQDVI